MSKNLIHPWADHNISDQSGKTYVITGANSGIGFATTQALAYKNAHIVMACRNLAKAENARSHVLNELPSANIDIVQLDLASLASVTECANTLRTSYEKIDVLINNAGLGWIERTETYDGFEMQIGANHLGHFALTGKLIGLLKKAPEARVVSVASLAHYWGRIHFEDLHLNRRYGRAKGYGQSKLANLLFGLELQRFFDNNNLDIQSIIAHPGMSGTNIANSALEAGNHKLLSKITNAITPYLSQTPQLGCLPTLHAATSSEVTGGEYFGPKHAFEIFGTPAKARIAKHARDESSASQLWMVSEELTEVSYQNALTCA